MKIKTLLLIAFSALMLTACGNSDSSDTHIPADVSTTTTTTATTTTTTTTSSEPTTTTTTTTSSTDNSSEPTVTTTTATTSSSATTSQPTTSDVTTSKATTTTKKKPTSTTTTTTTAKKTTTTTTKKPVDDSKYEMTGLMASYDRLRRGVPTEADEQAIIDDLCNYVMKKYNGKSGTFTYNTDGDDWEEACEGLGWNAPEWVAIFGEMRDPIYETFSVTKPFTLIINRKANFDNGARTNTQECNEYHFEADDASQKDAKENYYYTMLFRSSLYAMANQGISVSLSWYGEDSLTAGYGGDDVFDFYFCIDHTGTPLIDSSKPNEVIYVWYLCPTELYSDYYPDYEYAE